MNCVSRPVAPVGVTSTAAPCCSLKMRSGWIIAEPFAPTMSNQKRSPSPRWRQLTSTVIDTPFSHTISADPMSSTASFPGLVKCAEMRLGVGQPASHIPRSMSGRPRSSTAPPPACSRRSRHPNICRRSEEHTSELQSPCNLVCRLLLEKKKKHKNIQNYHQKKKDYNHKH